LPPALPRLCDAGRMVNLVLAPGFGIIIKMDKNSKLLTKLARIFSSEKQILAGYLFGSQAQGKATKESDLDIAIFVKNKFYHQRPELVQLIGSRALHLYYDNQYLRRLYNQHLKDLFEKNKYGY